MAITPITIFDPNTPWAGPGAGCLLCGHNVSPEGTRLDGLVGVDLDQEIEFEGRMGLCWDCAVQVGRAVNMEHKTVADERIQEATLLLAEAEVLADLTAKDAAQARLDKDTVVRLLGVGESVPA